MAKVQYTIRIEDPYLEDAKAIAELEIRSLNNLIEFFIAKGIEEYKKAHNIKTFYSEEAAEQKVNW